MKKRNPFIASFLSFLAPGLGNLYNSNINNFILIFISYIIISWSIVFINNFFINFFALFAGLTLFFFSIIQSFLEAKKLKEIELKKTNKLYIYFAIIIISSISNSFISSSATDRSYSIPAGSMMPTLHPGDYIHVNKNYYKNNKINYGDIVVFKTKMGTDFVKRVIALPDDEVQMINGDLVLNGNIVRKEKIIDFFDSKNVKYDQFKEKLIKNKNYSILSINDYQMLDNTAKFKVPKEHYFLMGDNRDNSLDSRTNVVGFVSGKDILHKVNLIYWSSVDRSRIGLYPK